MLFECEKNIFNILEMISKKIKEEVSHFARQKRISLKLYEENL